MVKETYRSASFPVAIASICDRRSEIPDRTSMPVRPNARTRARPLPCSPPFPRAARRKYGDPPLGPCLVAYVSCSTANAENAKKIPPTASELRLLVFAARWTARRGRRGLGRGRPILIDRL